MASGLWWLCLLTRIPFNMSYGPWNGSKWWQVTRAGAKEVVAKETFTNPLFQRLYPLLCKDWGEEPTGAAGAATTAPADAAPSVQARCSVP